MVILQDLARILQDLARLTLLSTRDEKRNSAQEFDIFENIFPKSLSK